MKVEIPANSQVVVNLPSVDWLYLYRATGTIQIEAGDSVGQSRRTAVMRQGQVIEASGISRLLISSDSGAQTIELQTGFGRFQPAVEAVTSTVISEISAPVTLAAGSQVSVTGTADVSGSTVVIGHIVDVSGSVVSVSGTADVSGSTVEVAGQRAASVSGSEITVTAGQSVTIAANVNRSRIILQNDSDQLTKCRVSHGSAVAATGLRLIGGEGMLGEQILQTTAALKIWNTSATDAVISVFEEIV